MQNPSESESEDIHRARLEEVERDDDKRWSFHPTYTEFKLLLYVGVGNFLDAYDLLIINPVSTMLQYRLYGNDPIPGGIQGVLKASANIGNVIGQFLFGYMGDALGRKALYGKELMLIIFGTIMCLTTPTGWSNIRQLSPQNALIYLTIFRIIVGIGVGADYPVSACVISDRAVIKRRGAILAYVVANQGWGSLVGALATIVVLGCYKHVMDDKGETSKVDGAWRIVMGLSLIPAFGTLYWRLTLPESTRYIRSQHQSSSLDSAGAHDSDAPGSPAEGKLEADAEKDAGKDDTDGTAVHVAEVTRKTYFREAREYFSEWRHLKILIGTSMCWFLLDVAFYGINLNQNFVLQQIGFGGTTGTTWNKLFKITTGNIIVTALGFLPGYYATVLTIETLGRKWIQIQGFLLAGLFLAILASKFHTLSHASFIVCFALLQFFFNFGANMTIYIIPAEVFPTKYRAFGHGFSAAAGKAGALISALVFNQLSFSIGTDKVLWSASSLPPPCIPIAQLIVLRAVFFGCCMLGVFFSLLIPEVRGRDPDAILAQEIAEAANSKR
ncbi:MFS general substrate transporter [Mycena pura]|uniref:MFS general substrate transporter n=1 Tax=Mycena pura TaxID=153505 RepID=A0AAD6UND5_9AGAR|nr:MFS general substrate transporter [Mycena pura]